MESVQIKENPVFTTIEVAAGATSRSFPPNGIGLNDIGVEGYAAVEVTVTGSGTATLGYQYSSDGITWRKPSTQAAISTVETVATGLTASGGPDGDGEFFFQLENLKTNKRVRFYITETGSSNSVTVTLKLLIQ